MHDRRTTDAAVMTDRILRSAILLLAAALGGCGACDGERETRRIDLGLSRPPRAAPPDPPQDAPPAAPAGEEIAATGEVEGGEPVAPGDPAAPEEPPEASAAAATGSAAAGVGATPPQQP